MSFNEHELKLMRHLAGAALPGDTNMDLPAADDELIFNRLLHKATPRATRLSQLIAACNVNADADETELKASCAELIDQWVPGGRDLLSRLLPLLLQAYYEDERVQQIYQRRPGPPFPEGYEVTQGDWSLLDEVRDRPPLYRREAR